MVFADTFIKNGENGRISIHDAMDHQKVNITESGTHASLNAQFSILVVAKHVYQ